MEHFILFEGNEHDSLLPLTYLRPVGECRVGMRSIKEKWEDELKAQAYYLTQSYLQPLYPLPDNHNCTLYINASFLPDPALLEMVHGLEEQMVLLCDDRPVAFKSHPEIRELDLLHAQLKNYRGKQIQAKSIRYPEDILNLDQEEFEAEYLKISRGRTSNTPDPSVRLRGEAFYIGNQVEIYDAVLNASNGPIFIDDHVEIMEGAVIRGPAYVGQSSKIHVGSKIYANTYLGPECRIGGEVKRTNIFGYSNKGHDGFLGDSVLGMWCNLGADTNNSNLKNTYGLVSLFDIATNQFRTTNRQFLGMILGDHTMSVINTSFNTGTVTGIFCNVLNKTPDRFIPSFRWGDEMDYRVDKAVEIARIAMDRRGIQMSDAYEQVIRTLAGK